MSKEQEKEIKRLNALTTKLSAEVDHLRDELRDQRRETQSNSFNFYLRSISSLDPLGEGTFRVAFEVRQRDLIHLSPTLRFRMREMSDMLWAELKRQGYVKGDAPDLWEGRP